MNAKIYLNKNAKAKKAGFDLEGKFNEPIDKLR